MMDLQYIMSLNNKCIRFIITDTINNKIKCSKLDNKFELVYR